MSEPEHISKIVQRVFDQWQDDNSELFEPSKPYHITMKEVTVWAWSEEEAWDRLQELMDKGDIGQEHFTIEEGEGDN